jgi:hypothetical protein
MQLNDNARLCDVIIDACRLFAPTRCWYNRDPAHGGKPAGAPARHRDLRRHQEIGPRRDGGDQPHRGDGEDVGGLGMLASASRGLEIDVEARH